MNRILETMFYKCHVGIFFLMIKVAASIENGFVFNGNFDLGGVAELSQKGLFRLTNSSTFGFGRAFFSQPLSFKNSSNGTPVSFSTTFVFAFVVDQGHLPGHGMAFMIAPSKNLTGALPAHYLGLFNLTNNGDPSNHVVAIELDTFQNEEFNDINGNHVGIDVNSLESVKSAPAGYFDNENGEFKNLVLSSGEPMQVWVEYDAPETQLNVTLAPIHTGKLNLPLLSLNIDISPIILEKMYVGFSSSTGQLVQSHYVLGWSFRLDGKAPELDLSQLPSFSGKEQPQRKERELVVGLSATGAVLLIIVTIPISIILWRRKKAQFTEILEDWEVQYGSHRFSYKDLFEATKGFCERELLGKGGFGKVYRGVLPGSNVQVGVKRISHNSKQGMKEFVAEIGTIGQLRHPNLVRVLGYCRGKEELILVYDYMPNGSLDKFLYNKTEFILNWNQRFKIIKDVALALTYLHEEWAEVIIHRDIKVSNVLLDGELNAKLGDFGLARCIKHEQDIQTTHVAGTLGYMAPELARSGKPTPSTDVYAFGAFCLEVACGRRPVEPKTSAKEMILVDWVYNFWMEGKILSATDPKLNEESKAEEVELVLKLGLLCSHGVAEGRPKMSQVLMYLKGQALLPENLNAHVKAQEGTGESENHAILCYSTPSLTITNSLMYTGR
ncbi:PREDICTED: L-type lectin-domain containing receptor kinase V.9-like isoform X1 [Populus euphratica]|uniref:non-specific serine/threonine protein kinase n=1 Tax=Populus euphratica TaxID=75702 RepID=A0AAJ6XIY6_POPEU|nr:PREDICTED: L-type lectin-domain containing receptor kinase V.9-like isoform X1 [Populus euphratica]